eukprot:1159331-Pelagomonas_calceolata.AAC.2
MGPGDSLCVTLGKCVIWGHTSGTGVQADARGDIASPSLQLSSFFRSGSWPTRVARVTGLKRKRPQSRRLTASLFINAHEIIKGKRSL